jgi:flagellin-like hook-associated protein FlgL
VTFTYDAAVTAITDANSFQNTLASLVGLDTGIGSLFSSQTTTGDDANTTSNISSITAGAATAAGTYALSYNATTLEFMLTDGVNVETTTYIPGSNAVSFNSGVIVSLSDTPVALTNGQIVFTVNQGSAITLKFQVGELASDFITVSIGGTSVSNLGLSTANVLTVDNAQATLTTITRAIDTLTSINAQIGAQQLELDYRQQVNTVAVENLLQARMVFNDTEMEKAMTEFTKYQVLSNVATAMLSQANKQMSEVISQLTRQ